MTILISDKIDFNSENIVRDKEGHYIMIKGSVHQEDKIIINIYALKLRAPKYTKQILTDLSGEIDSNTIKVRKFISLLSIMNRIIRKDINNEIEDFSSTMDQSEVTGKIQNTPLNNSRIYILLKYTKNLFNDRTR